MNTGEERFRLGSRFKPSAKLNIEDLLGFMNTGEERYRLVSRFKPSAKLNIEDLLGVIRTREKGVQWILNPSSNINLIEICSDCTILYEHGLSISKWKNWAIYCISKFTLFGVHTIVVYCLIIGKGIEFLPRIPIL